MRPPLCSGATSRGGSRCSGVRIGGLRCLTLALVCGAVWAAPAAATRSPRSARVAPASQVVLGSSFQPIRAGVGKVFASGDYLLSTSVEHGLAPIVVNDPLGTTTALDPSCYTDALGPPWVLLGCPESSDQSGPYDLELYSLADATRQTVTLSPGMPYCSSPPIDSEVSCGADAVGADWIEWVGTSYHHAPTEVYFQNIQTGQLRRDPTNATTFADLNSPALAQTTCPGVQVMRNGSYEVYEGNWVTAWGSLTPYGQFALAVTDHGAFLERCGTSMRRLLTHGSIGYSPDASAGAIVWQVAPGRLTGLWFPACRRSRSRFRQRS